MKTPITKQLYLTSIVIPSGLLLLLVVGLLLFPLGNPLTKAELGTENNLIEHGKALFFAKQCQTCHSTTRDRRQLPGPPLMGVYESTVRFIDGNTAIADEAYLRESLLDPKAKIVQPYSTIMPSYANQLSEAEIAALIGFIKSLQ